MKETQLKEKVNNIIAQSGDDEGAHASEDMLHLEVIRAFCPPWVVAEINRLSETKFARWCA